MQRVDSYMCDTSVTCVARQVSIRRHGSDVYLGMYVPDKNGYFYQTAW